MGLWQKMKDTVFGVPEEEADGWAQEEKFLLPPERAGRGVFLARPDRYVDAGKLADTFRQGTAVLLNLERVSPEAGSRIVDFLSGCAYARDGLLTQLADRAYLLTPAGVEVLDGAASDSLGEFEYDEAFGF